MIERIKAIENLLRILAKNHEITIKSEFPAKEVIEVIDFIRQFSANLSSELATLKSQAIDKQDNPKVVDAEVVSSPQQGSDKQVAG